MRGVVFFESGAAVNEVGRAIFGRRLQVIGMYNGDDDIERYGGLLKREDNCGTALFACVVTAHEQKGITLMFYILSLALLSLPHVAHQKHNTKKSYVRKQKTKNKLRATTQQLLTNVMLNVIKFYKKDNRDWRVPVQK